MKQVLAELHWLGAEAMPKSLSRLGFLIFAMMLGLWTVSQSCLAQTGATYSDQYKRALTKAQTIEPIKDFGEILNPRNGQVNFKSVDIGIPGTGPDMKIVRSANIDDGQGMFSILRNDIGDWTLEIPRIQTIAAQPTGLLRMAPLSSESPRGWQVRGSDKNARCTHISAPPDVEYPSLPAEFYAEEWWSGYQLVDLNGDSHPLVIRSAQFSSNGGSIGTMDHWVVSCLPSTANSAEQPGEAFLATAPDGTKYWFDYLVYDDYLAFYKSFPDMPPKGYTLTFSLPRRTASMLVTRIEDRHGNWLTYSYSAGILTGIDASDGRKLRISRGSNISITTQDAPNDRTWVYQINGAVPGYSLHLTRPDGSAWKYVGDFKRMPFSKYSFENCSQTYSNEPTGTRQVSVVAPSGATAQFNFLKKIFGSSYVSRSCHDESGSSNPEAGSAMSPRIWVGYALQSKVVSGPGLSTGTWSYIYGPHNGCWDPAYMTVGTIGSTACTSASPTTVWADRIDPDGTRLRSTYSNRWDQTENKLLKEEVYSAGGSLLRSTQYSYATAVSSGANPYAWPIWVGTTFGSNENYQSSRRWAPTSRVQVDQQGRQFVWQVASDCSPYALCFDQLSRPTKVTKSSSP